MAETVVIIESGEEIVAHSGSLSLTSIGDLDDFDTGDLAEGANLYYTDERVRDAVAAFVQDGTGISWAHDDVGNTLTPTVSLAAFNTGNLSEGANLYYTDERVDDRVAALLQDGGGLTWTYADVAGTLTPDIDHDALTGYVANEHVDHSAVTVSAGTGLSGGGDLTADRSFALAHLGLESLVDPGADRIAFWDDSATAFGWLTAGAGLGITTTTLSVDEGAVDHDALLNFVADEHVAHSGVTLTAGEGLAGGGTIAASRTFDLDITGLTGAAISAADELVFYETGVAGHRKIAFSAFEGTLDHDSLAGFVGNEHIDHSAVSISAGTGLSGGGDITASRSLALSHLGIESLGDPGADRVAFWDDSAGAFAWLEMGAGLSITDTTLNASGGSFGDDDPLNFGAGTDYWHVYDSTGTQYRFRSTDVDGAGADGDIFTVQDGTDDVVFGGTVSAPGSGTNSERFGAGATGTGNEQTLVGQGVTGSTHTQVVVIGQGASAGNNSVTVVGEGASASGLRAVAIGNLASGGAGVAIGYAASIGGSGTNVAIGASSDANGANAIALGWLCQAQHQSSVAIGRGAASTAANQIVFDDTQFGGQTDAYFASGVTNSSPLDFTVHATGGSGTNIGGADLLIAGGQPTGSGAGGSVKVQTAPAGATGTTLRSLVDRLEIDQKGNIVPGTAALATDATDGFLYVPTCAGTPTGTPTTYTGRVPLVYDSTNDLLYLYDGAWLSTTMT